MGSSVLVFEHDARSNVKTTDDIRIAAIEARLAEDGVEGTVAEVLLQYSLMKLNRAGYVANSFVGEGAKAAAYELEYEQAALNYFNMVQN